MSLLAYFDANAGTDFCHTNRQGGSGIWQVSSAQPCVDEFLRLSLAYEYLSNDQLARPSGEYERSALLLSLAWFANPHWQVGIASEFIFAQVRETLGTAQRQVGNAGAFVKYSGKLLPDMSAGAELDLRLPGAAAKSEAGRYRNYLGVVPEAVSVALRLLATAQLGKFELSAALGYTLDRSAYLLNAAPDDEQAASLNISSDRLTFELGAERDLVAGRSLAFIPFAELATALAGTDFSAIFRCGTKAELGEKRFMSLAVLLDARVLHSEPRSKRLPFIAPWQIEAQVSFSIDRLYRWAQDTATGEKEPIQRICHADSNCVKPQRCIQNVCQTVYEILGKQKAYRVLHGQVSDAVSGDYIAGATVRIGAEASAITTDAKHGEFATWPLDLDQPTYDLTISAPGYVTKSLQVKLASLAAASSLVVALSPVDGLSLYLEGTVRDASTGESVAARVRIKGTAVEVIADALGKYRVTLLPGIYQLVVSAEGYKTQIEWVSGDIGGLVSITTLLKRSHTLK